MHQKISFHVLQLKAQYCNYYHEGASKYLQFIENTLTEELGGIKVVVDGANGAASALISRLFADMGVDFTTIATHPNGLNINDHVGCNSY